MQEVFSENVITPVELLEKLNNPGVFKQIFEIVE